MKTKDKFKIELMRTYFEVDQQFKELKKQRETLGQELKALLRKDGHLISDDYFATMEVKTSRKLDKAKVLRIVGEKVFEKMKTLVKSEFITVSKK